MSISFFFTAEKDETIEGEKNLRLRYLTYLPFIPNSSGHREWDYDDVKASATYERGPWSAADIHWSIQHTYDFYLNTFGRKSFDDNGAPIYNLFYMPYDEPNSPYFLTIDPNNASAVISGSFQMLYGMGCRTGDQNSMYPVVELSVVAHEFTHMVTEATAKLVYAGESGALNESFSDLMGISVKKHVQGENAPWTIADGVMVYYPYMRNMQYPKMHERKSSPDTYKGEFWMDTEGELDHGGVHINSGVQNKWYYLLTDGDSGTNDNGYNYQVNGIGIEKSQQIAYRTLTEYATAESQYADIRLASLQAAEDLYGVNSAEVESVAEAWKAVGVDDNQTDIESHTPDHSTEGGEIYDLAGRRVNIQMANGKSVDGKGLHSGIYIVNGKKTLFK